MRKENVVDLVSEILYPGLFKEYNDSLNLVKQLLSMGYDSDCYMLDGSSLEEVYESLEDIQADELSRDYEAVFIGSDLSLEESDVVLKVMSACGSYLGYCSEISNNHMDYALLEKPVLKLYTNNHKELYEELLSKSILNFDFAEVQYNTRGMYDQERIYGIDYNSKAFIGKVKRFLKAMCKNNTFDMDFYERYSDVIDYFILYRYEYYDLDIREYVVEDMSVSWRFALGYSNGMFRFVAYREYS